MQQHIPMIIAVLALALTACGAPEAGQTVSRPAQPTSMPATPPTPARPTDTPATPARPTSMLADDVVVIYRKTGGIMGMDETLTIRADGTLTLRSRRPDQQTTKVDPATLKPLLGLLGSAEFAALEPAYRALGADLFVYEISLPGRAKPTVVTMDGAQPPAVLEQAIEQLEQLRQLLPEPGRP